MLSLNETKKEERKENFGFREIGKYLNETVPLYGIDFICQPSLFEELNSFFGKEKVEHLIWV